MKKLSANNLSKLAAMTHQPGRSYGTRRSGNFIVEGENLTVLTHLQKVAIGQFRCIYIDPPYNNIERYRHYDDRASSSEWLSTIAERLSLFMELLSEDGSVWISIDDNEMHYLKAVADSVFGRNRFIATIIWEQRTTRENRKVFSNNHEYILVYAKKPKVFGKTRNKLPYTQEVLDRYKNLDNDPRGPWQSVSANVQDGHATPAQYYAITSPSGKVHHPPNGRCWVYTEERMVREIKENNIWFGKWGDGVPRVKTFLNGGHDGLTPSTIWPASEVGTTKSAKKHLLAMFPSEPLFDTPKPEQLISRILNIATDPLDLVLDVYLGSGTTAAVAHKMSRRYLGVELNSQACSLCCHRLRLVVDGESGGISDHVDWQGGGGFGFFKIVG